MVSLTLLLLLYLLLGMANAVQAPSRYGYLVRLRKPIIRNRRKSDWVRKKLITLSVHYPALSCRKLADLFNQLFCHVEGTVGHTFVHGLLRDHQLEILRLRRELKRKPPAPYRLNAVWGVDLTGKGDQRGSIQTILGIIDHGSRLCIRMETLPNKCAWTLLGHLCLAIGQYGKPRAIRTDCEAIWTSRRFQWGLRLLGIRHQQTQPGCPWMNGRIERLFGTLKQKLDVWAVDNRWQLQQSLALFAVWYNEVRTHQHLAGWTPWQAWTAKNPYRDPPKAAEHFEAWDGLLQGVHIRR